MRISKHSSKPLDFSKLPRTARHGNIKEIFVSFDKRIIQIIANDDYKIGVRGDDFDKLVEEIDKARKS